MIRSLWGGVGERPETKGLRPSVVAEVLSCAGILTGWIGSKEGIEIAASGENIVVLGIQPSRAETGYGYIETGSLAAGNSFHVKRFTGGDKKRSDCYAEFEVENVATASKVECMEGTACDADGQCNGLRQLFDISHLR